ncbi:hypothetical protein AXG93_3671s1070 [Marchantia polymorpha subsp. ruderalis]|uniref:Uncharacterized protein n=1 Tax=Marchantia polymorpha subsp. ruderalis TaxID=1480154 RepID=A0A176WGL4_MARPO|nr:hypothetical protein AXG93_3671s1070 [Marchantia polymorpha subsp. ruderalis]
MTLRPTSMTTALKHVTNAQAPSGVPDWHKRSLKFKDPNNKASPKVIVPWDKISHEGEIASTSSGYTSKEETTTSESDTDVHYMEFYVVDEEDAEVGEPEEARPEGSTVLSSGTSTRSAEGPSITTGCVDSPAATSSVSTIGANVFSTLLSKTSVITNPQLAFPFGLARVLDCMIPSTSVSALLIHNIKFSSSSFTTFRLFANRRSGFSRFGKTSTLTCPCAVVCGGIGGRLLFSSSVPSLDSTVKISRSFKNRSPPPL